MQMDTVRSNKASKNSLFLYFIGWKPRNHSSVVWHQGVERGPRCLLQAWEEQLLTPTVLLLMAFTTSKKKVMVMTQKSDKPFKEICYGGFLWKVLMLTWIQWMVVLLCCVFVSICFTFLFVQNQNPLLSMLTPIVECLPPPQNSGGFHFILQLQEFMFITDPGVCVLGTYRLDRPSSLF